MAGEIGLGLAAVGIGLGLRHGIDWDHIAAITDVTSAQPSRARGFAMGTLYAMGHAAIVILLGLLAIWAAAQLPEWLDAWMETIVGITLITLGLWIFWTLIRNPSGVLLRSRWMLLATAIRSAWRWALRKFTGKNFLPEVPAPRAYGAVASTIIGMIHGVGAETGSQALLLASAAGATSATAGTFLLLAFAMGLIISNSLITIASTAGFLTAQVRRKAYRVLGVIVGSFSLVVGTLFLIQKGSILPGFFA